MSAPTKLGDGRIAFLSSGTPEAEDARVLFVKRYGETDCADADVIVALGGDGLMLQTLHRFMGSQKPIYGMNRGSVGFLMNEYQEDNLRERLAAALASTIHPLTMKATDVKGAVHEARAINEVSLLRQTYQAAKLRISIDGQERLAELIADGILIATPAGSTAYNLSAGGSVIEWGVDAVVVTFVAPHSLDGRPLILGRGHEVRIVSRTRDVGSRVVVDGHAQAHLGKGETAVIRMAPETARLAILPDRPFLSRYRDKFGH